MKTLAKKESTSLYRHAGPVTSLYLGLDDIADPARILARWQAMAHRLLAEGAPAADLTRLEAEVEAAAGHPGPRTLAAFCSAGELLLAHRLERVRIADRATYGRLPDGGPFLSWEQRRLPFLYVITDRTGADVTAQVWPDDVKVVQHVEGSNDEIQRSAPGGWSQRRHQQRALDSWQHNAHEVAAAVTHLCDEHQVRLIVVAGDVQAVQLLQKEVPPRISALIRLLRTGATRGDDGTELLRLEELHDLVEHVLSTEDAHLLRHWRDQHCEGGLAIAGAYSTSEALREGKVATLLVDDEKVRGRNAWLGPEAAQITLDRRDLGALGVRSDRVPLGDALIGAAVATDAEVRMIPAGADGAPTDGVGALVRYY